MRERGDQPVSGFARHDRIGVQGDDVLDLAQHLQIARLHTKSGVSVSSQQEIQLVQLAPLALPAHPSLFTRIPLGVAMKKVKRAGRFPVVFLIEPADAGLGLLDQGVLARCAQLRRIGQIGEQRKVQVRILIAQIVHL